MLTLRPASMMSQKLSGVVCSCGNVLVPWMKPMANHVGLPRDSKRNCGRSTRQGNRARLTF